jgi:peptide/nickel transport system ATP-binding protein
MTSTNNARPGSPAVMPKPRLQIENLAVRFKRNGKESLAVREVSLEIKAGETLALVGESGSGKSVTSLSVVRLLAKGAEIDGRILLNIDDRETDILSLSSREMRRVRGRDIGFIFQEPMTSLNPLHTVGRQVMEAIRLHRRDNIGSIREDAIQLLRDVGIAEPERRMRSYPHEMSGGMRQRVMIAIALACRPALLIADEPTTALDVTVQAQIIELLRQLQRNNSAAMLFITHDLALVSGLADNVAVMYAGQIVERAPAAQLFARPSHPYTQGLLAASPEPGQTRRDRKLEFIKQGEQGSAPLTGCAFAPRCKFAVPGVCTDRTPALEAISPDHLVRCARIAEIGA